MLLAPTLLLNAGSGAAIARPTFSRDFAGEKTLNNGTGPAITFTRGTNATYFDATGTLRFAPNNHIRNSQAGGSTNGVIGSGGVMPTNWSISANANGVTSEIVGTGTETGLAYIDIKVSGTPTAGASVGIFAEGVSVTAASNGQSWTASSYVKLAAGSTTNAVVAQEITGRNSAGNSVSGQAISTTITATSAALTTQRGAATVTMSSADVVSVAHAVRITYTNGNPIDLTLRIAAPQLELGSTATDYNPTTGTAYFGPRFDHDPANGASRGLLIEEARTNLLERSAEFENAYWTKTAASITANATAAPDGTTSADELVEDATLANHIVSRTTSFATATNYTLSVFAKANTRSQLRLVLSNGATVFGSSVTASYDLQTASVTGSSGTPTTSIQSVGNGWLRLSISKLSVGAASEASSIRLMDASGLLNYTGDGTSGLYIWGAQLEAGAFATSYIPTTTAAATRAADSAVVTPISSFYNQSEGAIVVQSSYAGAGSALNVNNRVSVQVDDNSSANRHLLQNRGTNGTGGSATLVANAEQAFLAVGSTEVPVNTPVFLGMVYKENDIIAAKNGTLSSADTSALLPTVSRLRVGHAFDGSNPLGHINGHIRKIAYWPKRLSNTLLQQLTT